MSHRQKTRLRRRRRLTLQQQRTRRGVLLLVTLSLLVLFLMIGSAFLLTAKQADKAAKASARGSAAAAAATDQGLLLDEVALQLLRGSVNRRSALHAHSLLEDMYGLDGFASVVPPPATPVDAVAAGCLGALPPLPNSGGGRATPPYPQPLQTAAFTVRWPDNGNPNARVDDVTGGQLLEIDLVAFQNNVGVSESSASRSLADDAYAGQVLTFVSGAARGTSTRIVGSVHRGNWLTLRVLKFSLADGSRLPRFAEAGNQGVQQLLQGARLVVNGRPFSGVGVGYDVSTPSGGPPVPLPRLTMQEQVGGAALPLALLPNAAFFEPNRVQFAQSGATTAGAWQQYFGPHAALADGSLLASPYFEPEYLRPLAGAGGADESYDAADFQNLALGLLPGANPLDEKTPSGSESLQRMPIPSFHRPELLHFWRARLQQTGGVLELDPLMLRKVLLRPSWLDHPNFTGSNPDLLPAAEGLRQALLAGGDLSSYAAQLLEGAIHGPWDVDNDGDGVRDSVWIDFGAPPMVGPNGKLVKPLAAVLCLDLDGRLNVNAAGSLDLAQAIPKLGVTDPDGQRLADLATMSDVMPRGFGYGPADISLQPALGNDFRRLLVGDEVQGTLFPGRYGQPHRDQRPGRVGRDLRAAIDRFGWPHSAAEASGFAEPPDLNCRYGVGVNALGQPVWEGGLWSEIESQNRFASDPAGFTLTANSPYELDLSGESARGETPAAVDMPFGVAELERVLRCFDADAGALPDRLFKLAGIHRDASDRLRVTTDSYDLPTPIVRLPGFMRPMVVETLGRPSSAAELLETRVRWVLNARDAGSYPLFPVPLPGPIEPLDDFGNNPQITPAERVRTIVRALLAPELASGERLDVNRPFGNGRDDNGNGVVDEPGEREPGERPQIIWPYVELGNLATATATANPASLAFFGAAFTPFDADGSGAIDLADDELQRQLFARHLYVLALTLASDADFGRSPQLSKEELALAERLAQWAVNAVDFRDPDNVMTPFEYDANPFDGWDVDGNVHTLNDCYGGDGKANTPDDRGGIVWGCERPELLMTETLAWHDRRTNDSGQEEKYPPDSEEDAALTTAQRRPDKDYDQVVRPRGAFFVELYNPWGSTPAANADTHARQGGFDAGINLGAVSPIRRTDQGSPVWRMVVHKRRDLVRKRDFPAEEAAVWDPDAIDPKLRPQTPVDRSVYFAGFDPDHPEDGVAFFNDVGDETRESSDRPPARRNVAPPVRPGRYLVVGGGQDDDRDGVYESPLGERKGSRNPANAGRSSRRIELDARDGQTARVRMVDADSRTVQDPEAKLSLEAPAEAIAQKVAGAAFRGDLNGCATDVLVIDHVRDDADGYDDRIDKQSGFKLRPLTLSEPARGYPSKFRGTVWSPGKQQYVRADDPNATSAIDIPLDGPIGGQIQTDLKGSPEPEYLRAIDPALTEVKPAEREPDPRASYAFVYLQRLANPLLPWNPLPGEKGYDANFPVNPYRTIDSISANLTVFNSSEEKEEDGTTPAAARSQFAGYERGYTATQNQQAATAMPSMWIQEPPSAEREGRRSTLKKRPANRLGSVPLAQRTEFHFNAVPDCTLGFLNRAYQDPQASGDLRKLKPRLPFEWLTWNNRPYVSGNELTLVPRVRSSQLLRTFSTGETAAAGGGGNAYTPFHRTLGIDGKPLGGEDKKLAFGHLENFFFTAQGAANLQPNDVKGAPKELYRVLDYVHAPALFSGTQFWLSPAAFSQSVNPLGGTLDPRYNRLAPFNRVSLFRDPGKINLNTVVAEDVWRGLFHGNATPDAAGNGIHPGPNYDRSSGSPARPSLVATRRSDGAAEGGPFRLDARFPTFFNNPFRGGAEGDLVPLQEMVRADVDATLLRSSGGVLGANAQPGQPLFTAATGLAFNHAARNAFFWLQPIARLDNLTTTRSNVYAVWITIGFFEVDEAPDLATFVARNNLGGSDSPTQQALYNRVYPDGYALGREEGSDTGGLRRLRGFYVIDRSIPVGFELGADHNVEQAIRLRRRID